MFVKYLVHLFRALDALPTTLARVPRRLIAAEVVFIYLISENYYNMKNAAMTFAIYAVASSLFVAKLAINSYYKIEGASASRESSRKREVGDFYSSRAYMERIQSDSLLKVILFSVAAQKRERNEISLRTGGTLRHDGSISAIADSIRKIDLSREAWAQKEVASINSAYAKSGSGVSIQWGGIGLIYVFEVLALLFGFLAAQRGAGTKFTIPRVGEFNFRIQFWICTAASFYAEYASCQITLKALVLLVGDDDLAQTYSTAFMLLSPTLFAIGGLYVEDQNKQPEKKEVVKKETPIATQGKVAVISPARSRLSSRIKKPITPEKQYAPYDDDPTTFDEAIEKYATGVISKEKGAWSVRRIAVHFLRDVNRTGYAHKFIKARREEIANDRKNGKLDHEKVES